jgi:ankyrin repeat protein
LPIAPAPSGRDTALHCAAIHGHTKSAVPLLVGGADQTVTDNSG